MVKVIRKPCSRFVETPTAYLEYGVVLDKEVRGNDSISSREAADYR